MTSTDADTETGTQTGTQTTAHQGTGSGARSSPFRHAETDRDAAPQFVLPLVVRIEKAAPPARTDALETAARAVLVLLSDERATAADGEWAQAVRDWQDARIRKVVRRARGAEWRRASGLPGITVMGGAPAPATAEDVTGHEDGDVTGHVGGDGASSAAAAEVRVFPPVPLDGWPKELAKLQVSGTDLDDPEPPTAPDPTGPVLWLSPQVEMSAGKAMAQAGHGAQLAWWELDDAARAAWREAGFPLAVRTASAERWDELTASGLPVVRDAGFTEIAPGSCTVVADHPALRRR
ncbi:peptidyl-tRNA hydrolase [Streptomyces rhizosphaericus]|uniref:peptidyl-tRNA hydrolase n=1 Tax=Streptomyces rhizosphaericus TaxID=114699 RepID=A0A6G4AGC8_9ACTN|nr:peptidyl-tRNA hydrolase [Streptomyces rhizosphaericus]NEW71749.1 peptidyl-tRNA hydrolase [Streptomyces rhizosphaericus]